MDRNVGSDVPFPQHFPQRTLAVAGIGGQRHRWQGQPVQPLGNRFRLPFRGVGDPTGQDESAPKSTMAFPWYYKPGALPILLVCQRASVSIGPSGILPSGL